MMLVRVTFCLVLFIHGVINISAGDTIYVSVNGDDLGTGKFNSPYKTIARAFTAVSPGNIIFLRSGLYRERVVVTKSGEKGNPIVLTGEKGAIIDGGTLITGWEKFTTYGGNIYRVPYPGTKPYNLTWNNRYILRIRDEFSVFPGMDTILRYGPKGWDTYEGPPYYSWDGVQTMWGTNQNYLYIGFGNPAVNPNNEEITIAPSLGNNGAVITLNGSHYVHITGLTVRNGYNGIYFKNSCSDCIVENDSVVGGKYCINITSGSSRIHIRKNELTLGYLHSLDPRNSRHWFIWAAFKKNSDYDRICVSLDNVGADNIISENHMFENFDGVENTGTSLRLVVRDNFIERLGDDGLEPCGEETEARWHGNLVVNCNIAYRHKEITGNGPMYVYRNKFYCSSEGNGSKSGIYFFSGESTTAFIYHNTIVTPLGFSFGSTNVSAGLPNLWLVNNLFSCTKIFNENTSWTKKPHFDYNYFGGDLSWPPSWWGINNKVVWDGRIFSLDSVPDFMLKSDSPAREIGTDITKTWTSMGITHQPLAGYPPDYFLGSKPDAGAEIYGKILDNVRQMDLPGRFPLEIFPNPFSHSLTLRIKNEIRGILNIRIINLNGSEIFQGNINPGCSGDTEVSIPAGSMEPGIYVLQVLDAGKYLINAKIIHL